jgi:tetratricopeptide (TPR) repeat protein
MESAEKYLRQAILIRKERAPLSLALAESFYYLGDIMVNRNEQNKALEYHRQALELRSLIVPLSLDVADSFHAMGNLTEGTGRWQEALSYYGREFIARDTDSVETAKVHNIIGNILLKETDRINDAVSNHQMAVAIQSSHGESAVLAKYLEDLIISIREKGESSSEYEQQLEKIRKELRSRSAS